MSTPKVSIIVPIYGVEKYIHQCVDSILAQTLKDIEILLVDDGSKDRCPEIVDEYAKKDKRIVAIHKPNGGYGSAVNKGLEAANGEYIGIVEPDDWIDTTMYEKLYNKAKTDNVDIVKSKFYIYYDIDKIKHEENKYLDINWYNNKREAPRGIFTIDEYADFFYFHPSIWSAIYKASLIKDHNISLEEIPGAGWTDNLFQVQTMCLAKSITYLDEALYFYRNKNFDDALDLKDQTIPFLRTRSIHKWLKDNNITNKEIWSNLCKREIAYIHIVFRSVKLKKFKDIIPLIQEWRNDLPTEYIDADKLNTVEKRILRNLNKPKLIWYHLIKHRYLSNRSYWVSLRIRKTGFLVQLLGMQFSVGNMPWRRAWFKVNIG